ncbi:TPA: restriction endonuclease subunit S, partial [Campylobacter coli]|nr:restriction endonuclease subunit S [Campylobacter coli]
NGYDSFLNIINNKDANFTPKNNENYNYIELANIGNNGNINEPISDLGKNLPTRARRIVSNGDVIISSIEGSLSSCALITQEFDKHLVSTGFFVLNSKLLNSETLLVMFKSQIFQEYLKKFPSGTILCAINKEELSKIFIPKIDPTTQEKIAKYIQESFNLRKKSKQLLDNAKIKVEEQIQGKV